LFKEKGGQCGGGDLGTYDGATKEKTEWDMKGVHKGLKQGNSKTGLPLDL